MEDHLLNDVKTALNITWDESNTDIIKLIERAKAYLNNLVGVPLDFSFEDDPKTLLIERCRYVFNNAADEFEINFQHELSRLILREAIKAGENNEQNL